MSSVDVIVPCYAYGQYLQECVQSVLSQSGVDVRVLIIDDCSPDNTKEVGLSLSQQDPRVTFVHHAVNQGHIATYNEGIAWVSSSYYMVLSADDYLLPGALRRTATFMDANPIVGLAHSHAITLNVGETMPAVSSEREVFPWQVTSGANFIRQSGARNLVATPTAVVRTSLQKSMAGYRPDLPHTADMELWFRLAARSAVAFCPGFHAVYRRHAANMSLAYMARCWLPDLQERKAALRAFFDASRGLLPRAEPLYRRSLRLLAREAVAFSSSAFDQGDPELSRELSHFALELFPAAWLSARWAKLACKRRVGLGAWQTLRSPLSKAGRIN